jgi:DNA-binding CsgD family transcriptional regulator
MDYFDLAQDFVEHCVRDEPPGQLRARFESALSVLGFRYFACCSRADPAAGQLLLHNYPRAWIEVVTVARLYENDPVLLYAETILTPFSWTDAPFCRSLDRRQKRIMAAGASQGLVGGYTIPLRFSAAPRARRVSCSIVPDHGVLEQWRYRTAEQLSVLLHAAVLSRKRLREGATKTVCLSRRQRECLESVARGRSDWTTSRALRISESTVRTHIDNAKWVLGVDTRAQAVACALMSGQIGFGDLHLCRGTVRSSEMGSFGGFSTRANERDIETPSASR